MNIEDFIKLPAIEAGRFYRQYRDAGDTGEASRLHQAYFEANRVKLSDGRQIAEAASSSPVATPEPAKPPGIARQPERSKVRRSGTILSVLGLVIGLFAVAAGIGPAGLVIGGCLASGGFALWLVGIVEDRLLAIQQALGAHRL